MNSEVQTQRYALSPMQEGMLFHALKEPRGGVDIEQLVIDLPEPLDPQRMESAWHWLVQRHEVFRTRFHWKGNTEPWQEILPAVQLPFAFKSLPNIPSAERAEHVRQFLLEDRARGLDPALAPMARVLLIQWEPTAFTLIWTLHHALVDGRCFPILLREVFETYEDLATGVPRPRPLPPSFSRHLDTLTRVHSADSDQFWSSVLSGFKASVELPIRRASTDGSTPTQAESWIGVDSATTRRLKELAAAEGLTLNTLLQGAWAVLLHRYTGETDIVFGATRACRKSSFPGAEDCIGLFINTVPVRLQIQDTDPILEVCRRARNLWVTMRPFENVSLSHLKSLARISAAQPLFHSLLVFEHERLDHSLKALGGSWSHRSLQLHELTNFPLALALYGGDSISIKAEFDSAAIDALAVQRVLGHFCRILHGLSHAPHVLTGAVELLDAAERLALTQRVQSPTPAPNSTALPLDGAATLQSLFSISARQHAESIAVQCDEHSLSYRKLNSQADRVAHHLVQLGVGSDTLVGLFLDRTHLLVVGLVGIVKAGGAYLPIDLAYPPDRMAYMLEDARAPVLLSQRSLADKIPTSQAKVLFIEDLLEAPEPTAPAVFNAAPGSPEDLAYVIYTSGTTGKPKGSMITHRNVVRLFSQTEAWFGFGPRDVWTLFHSIAFDFSVWELWGALLYGGKLVVVPYLQSRSPKAFYQLLSEQRVTVLNQTPSAFRQLMSAEESEPPRPLALRTVIFGGEALDLKSLEPWFDRHGDSTPRLINMYGITETTVHVTYRPVSRRDVSSGSVIGLPIPDLHLLLLDSRRHPVPIGVPGEIHVAGPGLARGYLHRPELTADRFIPHPFPSTPDERLYRTGDLARWLPNGDIEYLGRIDHQVKIRGFRIELGEIEAGVSSHPSVAEGLALVREDVAGDKRLVAYWVARRDASIPTDLELRQHLRRSMPEYMIPSAFVQLPSFPLTAHGKVDRKALPPPQESATAAGVLPTPPKGALEETIAQVCRTFLQREHLGVEDNFFDVGAHSILLVRIHQKLVEVLNREFPLVDLFQHTSVRTLAQHLSAKTGGTTPPSESIAERARKQREAANRLRQNRSNRSTP